ncbi:PAS and ANTAR domain-containing protein [uncultured Nocardioides sp.]|uniref:PAS and ANTAR domain-containing protein n=1 Tax=uncultured Nocardioides sp. TaxID=198441 RepID=UPI0025EDC548|nr:PAS and ANTAR domain-containing protein [uncultured Nocardioides sp.]
MDTVVCDGLQPQGEVGHFTYDVAADRWCWSDGFYAIYGYAPQEVPATLGVLLAHKHPDDRDRVAATVRRARTVGGPFSFYHRVIDRSQRVRSVLSVGHGLTDGQGRVDRIEGFIVDLTAERRTETEAEVQLALARVAENRAVIDQAKGMVMLATGCEGDIAFDQLRRCSHHANLKLHEVARRLVRRVEAGGQGADLVMTVLTEVVESSRRPGTDSGGRPGVNALG